MNLEELQAVRETERSKNSIQALRESFYEDAAAFIEELRERRDHAAAEAADPFDDPEIRRLTDEIASAEQTVEAIYERRVGKLVKQASFAAASMPTEDESLTREERALYEDLVDLIEDNRQAVLATLSEGGDGRESGSPPGEPSNERTNDGPPMEKGTDGPDSPPDRAGPEESAGGADEAATASSEESSRPGEGLSDDGSDAVGTESVPRTTVRITADIGEIVGIDERTYDLAPDDVVTLPEPNAQPLLERQAATKLE